MSARDVVSAPKRIGIFGGTFDPVHVGHLVAVVNAMHGASLDQVLMVVANVPWQKERTRAISPAWVRFALLKASIDGVQGLEASDIEIRRGGKSYTIDTVRETSERYPEAEIFLIVGGDAARGLASWERSERLSEMVTLIVVNRPGTSVESEELAGWRTLFVEVPAIDISSTDIRARVRENRPLDFLLTRESIDFIHRSGLYLDGTQITKPE
ncbi:MAG: nicotinate-nucleotide adenylyltransferase [Actinomycetota bacterium]|nr:nicotinate-nucleotide adenylyltransferase [Actinomycetota bacterium]